MQSTVKAQQTFEKSLIKTRPNGQAALEYLLLIGGAVLLSALVISLLANLGGTGADFGESAGNELTNSFNALQAGFGFGNPVIGDTIPPTIAIDSPANNAIVSGNVAINATATDASGIAQVEFYIDNALQSTDTSFPYFFDWDTTIFSNSSHSIKVKAYDNAAPAQNSAESSISVSVNNFVPDLIAPTDITDLSATTATADSVTLAWTAPGDHGTTGTATIYDVRYSTSTITSANFATATQVVGEPNPTIAGFVETFAVTGLNENTDYFFAIKTSDEVPNVSGLSNVETKTTDYSLRFLQFSDTHLITGATCTPWVSYDGRTDCRLNLVNYTAECASGTCQWIDPIKNVSKAPTIVFQDSVAIVNSLNPSFSVITGDLVSFGGCDQNKIDAFNLVESIADTFSSPHYVVGANIHDEVDNPACRNLYLNTFGPNSLNWNFSEEDNLFIGLSEINSTLTQKFDNNYLESVLIADANQNKKLFIFSHGAFACYDEIEGADLGCNNPYDTAYDIIKLHKTEYRSVVILSGHNHATVFELKDGIYHFTTTALMNYPTEFRIIDVTKNSIHVFMSPIVNQAVTDLSLEIFNNPANLTANNPLSYSGIQSDREQTINLPPI